MSPPSPNLIAFHNPVPRVTLLEYDEEKGEDVLLPVSGSSLRPAAAVFVPNPIRKSLPIRPGILIGSGSSAAFRPRTVEPVGQPSRRSLGQKVTVVPSKKSFGASKNKGTAGHTGRNRPPSPSLPTLVSREFYTLPTSFEAFGSSSEESIIPSRNYTPQLTPPSSFLSRIQTPELTNSINPSILISNPNEISGLFRLNIKPLPFPDVHIDNQPAKTKSKPIGKQPREVKEQPQPRRPREEAYYNSDSDGEYIVYRSGLSKAGLNANTPVPSFHSPVQYNDSQKYSSLSYAKQEFKREETRLVGLEYDSDDGLNFDVPAPDFGSIPASHRFGLESRHRSMPVMYRSPSLDSAYSTLLSLTPPRLNVPDHLRDPYPTDDLQSDMMFSWMDTEPSRQSKEYLKGFLERLTVLINTRLSVRGGSIRKGERRFEVDVFGSVSWGGETGKSGDLDLVILDLAVPEGYHPRLWKVDVDGIPNPGPSRALPTVYHLWTLSSVLADAGMVNCQPITHASTPIVKFVDPVANFRECDLNVNDLGGWYNSSLILHYCLIAPHLLRPMIHSLKLWAAAHDLNDPSGSRGHATMSSYCLTLMIVTYLQIRGCLPNLQTNVDVPIPDYPDTLDQPDTVWVGWGKNQGIKAHIGFDKQPPLDWRSREPALTTADALRGFFAYFSKTPGADRFDYDTSILSVLNGGVMPRSIELGAEVREETRRRNELVAQGVEMRVIEATLKELKDTRMAEEAFMGRGDLGIQPRNWGERRLVVQDPFLWQKNCAGQMSKVGFDRFQATVDNTHRLLEEYGPSARLEQVLYRSDPPSGSTPRRGKGKGRGGGDPGRGTPVRGGRGSPYFGRSPFSSAATRGSPVGKQLFSP